MLHNISKYYSTGCDYTPEPYVVIIPAREKSFTFSAGIIDDNLHEGTEKFQLKFVKGTLNPSTRAETVENGLPVTIIDNDESE